MAELIQADVHVELARHEPEVDQAGAFLERFFIPLIALEQIIPAKRFIRPPPQHIPLNISRRHRPRKTRMNKHKPPYSYRHPVRMQRDVAVSQEHFIVFGRYWSRFSATKSDNSSLIIICSQVTFAVFEKLDRTACKID
jgi:hypothetical protein